MSLQSFWKFHFFADIARIRIYAISLIAVCMLLLFTSGSVFARPTQLTFSHTQLDFTPLESGDTIQPDIQNAMDQVPPDKMQAAQNAYGLAKENPENVQVQTVTVNSSQTISPGVSPQVFIPGIGQFTIRVYSLRIANAVPVPYGFGLYFPLATAKNLIPVGGGVAVAIAFAVSAHIPELKPFSPVITVIITNVLNTIPNYIVNQCQEQSGGFTVAIASPTPFPFCGSIPEFAL